MARPRHRSRAGRGRSTPARAVSAPCLVKSRCRVKSLGYVSSRCHITAFCLALAFCLVFPSSAAPIDAQEVEPGAYVIADTWGGGPAQRPADSWPAASGLAVDAGRRIYVADAEDARISVIEPDGGLRLLGDGADLGLVEPRDLAIDDARGRLYVADPGLGGVAVLGLDGSRQDLWTGLPVITGIGVAPDGRVLAGAALTGEVHRFEADGQRLTPIRAVTQGAGTRISGLDVAADGTLVVLDATRPMLQRFDARGSRLDPIELPRGFRDVVADFSLGIFTRQWYWFTDASGLHAYDPLRDAWHQAGATDDLDRLAVHPPLGIVASQAHRDGSWRIHRFDYRLIDLAGLRPAASWGRPRGIPGLLESPDRIHVGADGMVYLLDRWPRLQRFDRHGQLDGQLLTGFRPASVAVDTEGQVYAFDGGRRVVAFGPDGAERWRRQLDDFLPAVADLALDPTRDELMLMGDDRYAEVRRLRTADGQPVQPLGTAEPLGGTFRWADLAAGPDGVPQVLDLRGPGLLRIPLFDAPGVVDVGLGARRLAVRPDGLRLLLGRDGWVRGRDEAGQLRLAFDASRQDLDPGSRPADLSVDADGDVYVIDRVAERVTHWTWDPEAEPPTVPEVEPGCLASGDKGAAPDRIQLGETVEVQLQLGGRCGGALVTVPMDVMLIMDRSGSMAGDQIRVAVDAALDFVARADWASTRIGLVSFNSSARVDLPMGLDGWAMREALAGLQAGGGTNIAEALSVARESMLDSGRLSTRWVFVLLSDGGSDRSAAIAEAERSRDEGIEIFSISVQADAVLMRAVADDAEHYFEVQRARELFEVFDHIAERIEADALMRRVEIIDDIPSDMTLVDGSVEPAPAAIEPGPPVRLRWQLEGVPESGALLRYRLRPTMAGLRPTNERAWADYVDGFGRPGRIDFPVPEVLVIGPTTTPSPSPRASATARPSSTSTRRPTPIPRALFLPLLLREDCRPGSRHTDVLLVMDASGSMQGAKLAAARDAALQLVDLLDLGADQVGLVAFHQQATRLAALGSPRADIARALAGLATSPGTRIDRGLSLALAELIGPRARPGNTPTLVLLTDGRQAESPQLATARAAEARALGIQLFAIGLGAEVDRATLESLAGARQRAFLAPGPEDLAAIYRSVAGLIPCPAGDFWARR